jgi:hypothetical protein
MRGNWDGHNYSSLRSNAAASAAIQRGQERIAVSEDKLANWRYENPDAMGTWTTKYGCVVAFGGMKVYYGRCRDCGGLVTTRRPDPPRQVVRSAFGRGRWPERCPDCRRAVEEAHDDRARARMAKIRAERRRIKPKYDLLHQESRLGGWADILTPEIGALVGRSLGIWCLECGEVIKFALHVTFPRPIPWLSDTRKEQ